jgi:type I restriction enzyme M protein
MLNDTTKRKINSLRQILVGKVPDPKSQVEQITNALIYKYMDDMDRQAEVFGGKPSFFVKEYEKYAWRNLMSPKLGGQERMNLYMEALEKMGTNPNLSPIFRDILKNSYVPYRSPETLNLFLSEIDGFAYDHSEDLGDAFEYLLSIMGAQGDAGQFRTPRHIIDFIVEVVDPKKTDKILDPACGTAGFLISAYKHIQNNNKKENPGDTLTNDERHNLHKNFVGYDISPEMAKLSRVNMFLHNFPDPKIYEYDTLSSEERWQDTYSVILANPPFMSPKGGIIPHKKFRIPANRAEVLFTDYIVEHLKPNGRAGIIVPEGIIFQSAGAYKDLRKMLVEEGLFAVVSLPSGVFNPYAGVKTSVLLFDNSLAKQTKEILFVKIENDGYDLGAQRRPINKNDLPEAVKILRKWKEGKKQESKLAVWVEKAKIAESGEYNLSGDRYRTATDYTNAKWPMVELGEVLDYEQPTDYIVKTEDYNDSYPTPVLTAGKSFILGHTNEKDGIFHDGLPVIIFDDFTTATKFVDFAFKVKSSAMKILHAKKELADIRYIYFVMQNIEFTFKEHKRFWISEYSKIKIPLPPLEIQKQIVAELEGYQNIITGAKQITKNWKPKIEIDPTWEKVKLGEVCEIKAGGTPPTNQTSYYENGDIPWLKSEVCKDEIVTKPKTFISEQGLKNSSAKWLVENTTLIALVGATIGKTAFITFKATTNQNVAGLYPKNIKQLDPFYLYLMSQTLYDIFMKLGDGGFKMANLSFIKDLEIPLPPLATQKEIVEKIEAERALVESAKKLIDIYTQKTKETLAKLWSE